MSMVVRTNTMAMNANSALNKNNSTVAGNLQKLSTGFRINRAADDASGLAVSEKMKAQIKALDQAGKNAQDGASLIKTAEGYMGEIHDMLNRIVELAEKSANGTYETKTDATTGKAATESYRDTGVDRQAIQDEVDQLTTEIDRIAATANFNGLKLLNGDLDGSGATAATGGTDDANSTGGASTTPTYYKATENWASTKFADNAAFKTAQGSKDSLTVYGADGKSHTVSVEYTAASGDDPEVYAYTVDGEAASTFDVTAYSTTNPYTELSSNEVAALEDGATVITQKSDGTYESGTYTAPTDDPNPTPAGTGKALKLQIGETSSDADKLEVSIKSFSTKDLFASLTDVAVENKSDAYSTASKDGKITGGKTINVSNQDTASQAAEDVRKVINEVSARRATLGAMENRLDYTMNNLDTASQNITDANSRIRDTDMAKTMMQYTQGNTLTQAAQAMLAQANQAPSQVLQLLQ